MYSIDLHGQEYRWSAAPVSDAKKGKTKWRVGGARCHPELRRRSLALRSKRRTESSYIAWISLAMQAWPIPYAELDIPGRFGTTHVAVSGPQHAPPLVLLHGYRATSAMWSPNIADLSRACRTYAIDVMGQPSKSFSEAPIRSADDYVAWLTATLDVPARTLVLLSILLFWS